MQTKDKTILPDPEITTAEKFRGLRWSYGYTAANAIFMQFSFFGSIFVLYLNRMGVNKIQIGLLLAVLPFTDSIALFIMPMVARFGTKRTFLIAMSLRTFITLLLVPSPWVMDRYGQNAVLIYLILVVMLFSICRSFATTASLPWTQEYIPNEIRGMYSAKNIIFSNLAGLIALAGAGFLIDRSPALESFHWIFLGAVIFGFLSVWSAAYIPGGRPYRTVGQNKVNRQQLLTVWRDKNYLFYLIGIGLILVATIPLAAFLPLYMKDVVGLSTGNVVFLQTGTLIGILFSGYLWGWAADRYGSKPIMLLGLLTLILLPILWYLMPKQSEWSMLAGMLIAILQGVATQGWTIGTVRLLYNSLVPPEKNLPYMAVYNAWYGIISGLSQIAAGYILEIPGIKGQFLSLPIDAYSFLFAVALVTPILCMFFLTKVPTDSPLSMDKFADLWLQGNPLQAVESLIGYSLARDERATISATERLGQAKSPLTSEELLTLLYDPRFFVRFEALISIARNPPTGEMITALTRVLHGNDPALSVMAAWALGRIGDPRALPPLRAGLNSSYRSVRAYCARSLGALNDQESLPQILEQLAQETDPGLRIAYASALGQMRTGQVTPYLLDLLRVSHDEDVQMEIVLALARITGDEHYFIDLLRRVRTAPDTTLSQVVMSWPKKFKTFSQNSENLQIHAKQCLDGFSQNDLATGAKEMAQIIQLLPMEKFAEVQVQILRECKVRLEEAGVPRIEYILLALHTIKFSALL